jgi:O-methyltransferase
MSNMQQGSIGFKKRLKIAARPFFRKFVTMPVMSSIFSPENVWNAALVKDFVDGGYGREYGVTRGDRVELIKNFQRNVDKIQSGTSAMVHLVMAREILSIPMHVKGDVVECGCWKGASSASLSLVCQMVKRRLLVCDSFQGLPDDNLQLHTAPHAGFYGYYTSGMFCGQIDEVRENIRKYGALEVSGFVQGFFNKSLPSLTNPIAFAFLDVDLVSSMQDCVQYIWPLLVEGGLIYTDDAGDLDCVNVFFDEVWWSKNLKAKPPGFVGSGCGLALNPKFSSLGYAKKLSKFEKEKYHKVDHLYYPEAQSL